MLTNILDFFISKELRDFRIRIFLMFILGFSSGLPLSLVGSTLVSWYTSAGINMLDIGLLSLISQPYIFKFLWAPIFDVIGGLKINKLDKRRSWIIFTQAFLILGLILTLTLVLILLV